MASRVTKAERMKIAVIRTLDDQNCTVRDPGLDRVRLLSECVVAGSLVIRPLQNWKIILVVNRLIQMMSAAMISC